METLCTVIVVAAVLGPFVLLVVGARPEPLAERPPDAVRLRAELDAIAVRRAQEEPDSGSTTGRGTRSVGIRAQLVGRASGSAS